MQTEYGTDIALTPQLELTQSTKFLDPAIDAVARSAWIFSMPRRALIDLA